MSWYHFTFNGAPGSILEDPALRRAVAKGIDRKTIADGHPAWALADNPVPLNNHIYVAGQEGYQDNSGVVAFDPEKAKQVLDGLGWKMNGQFREKDGRQLVIRDVLFDSSATRQFAQIARNTSPRSRVKLDLDNRRPAAASSPTTSPSATSTSPNSLGVVDAFPLSSADPNLSHRARRATSARSAARRSMPRSRRRVGELDPRRRARWPTSSTRCCVEEVFSLPLTQSTGNVAVRSTWRTSARSDLADADYTKIGFMK